jgi:hypothetical protein
MFPDEFANVAGDQRGPAFPVVFVFASDTDDIHHNGV